MTNSGSVLSAEMGCTSVCRESDVSAATVSASVCGFTFSVVLSADMGGAYTCGATNHVLLSHFKIVINSHKYAFEASLNLQVLWKSSHLNEPHSYSI